MARAREDLDLDILLGYVLVPQWRDGTVHMHVLPTNAQLRSNLLEF